MFRTIADFSEQWRRYPATEGYHASAALLADILAPLVSLDELRGRRVAEIGSGIGRLIPQLLGAGVAHAVALEPSDGGFAALVLNTGDGQDRITYLKARGEELPPYGDLDYVLAVGVLHHIPEPAPVVRAAYAALRPGGRFIVWLYGREGHTLYLLALKGLRFLTTRLPSSVVSVLMWALDVPLRAWVWAARRWSWMPMRPYLVNVVGHLSPLTRRLTIYDQLRPSYARYYDRKEAGKLLADAGFVDVRLHHRHGYSWLVVGTRPDPAKGSGGDHGEDQSEEG